MLIWLIFSLLCPRISTDVAHGSMQPTWQKDVRAEGNQPTLAGRCRLSRMESGTCCSLQCYGHIFVFGGTHHEENRGMWQKKSPSRGVPHKAGIDPRLFLARQRGEKLRAELITSPTAGTFCAKEGPFCISKVRTRGCRRCAQTSVLAFFHKARRCMDLLLFSPLSTEG